MYRLSAYTLIISIVFRYTLFLSERPRSMYKLFLPGRFSAICRKFLLSLPEECIFRKFAAHQRIRILEKFIRNLVAVNNPL